jgi:glycosyltransferase involved in cell wall biosynthesis
VQAKRIGILIVAYNASSTLAEVLNRIPPDFRSRVSDVLVCDDHSDDTTYLVGLGYRELAPDLPLEVIRRERNLGYGGNQKAGYRWAIEHGLDIVVLLHGDGQYAPELLPQMVAPLERGESDAVFGSRMLEPGAARRGGMPRYKYFGNRILTTVQNALTGTELSEWHSGYRAYSVDALREIPFDRNSDGFDFDTEIIVQLHEASKRIIEIPVPTYYGDEICRVDGLRYARDVVVDTTRYRLHRMGLGSGDLAFASDAYELKLDPRSSHGRVLAWLRERPPVRVLDLGCGHGSLAEQLRGAGHHVTGVDLVARDGVLERVDTFVAADLDDGIPDAVGGGFDVVVIADVLEHVREPGRLLGAAKRCVRAGGAIVVSVPNFAHWYPRMRVALGRFDYDRRGILDRGHMRFFTRRSFERLAAGEGLTVHRRAPVGLPLEVVDRGRSGDRRTSQALDTLQRVDSMTLAVRPTLFAYQFVYELRAAVPSVIDLRDTTVPEPDAEPLVTQSR